MAKKTSSKRRRTEEVKKDEQTKFRLTHNKIKNREKNNDVEIYFLLQTFKNTFAVAKSRTSIFGVKMSVDSLNFTGSSLFIPFFSACFYSIGRFSFRCLVSRNFVIVSLVCPTLVLLLLLLADDTLYFSCKILLSLFPSPRRIV